MLTTISVARRGRLHTAEWTWGTSPPMMFTRTCVVHSGPKILPATMQTFDLCTAEMCKCCMCSSVAALQVLHLMSPQNCCKTVYVPKRELRQRSTKWGQVYCEFGILCKNPQHQCHLVFQGKNLNWTVSWLVALTCILTVNMSQSNLLFFQKIWRFTKVGAHLNLIKDMYCIIFQW